MIYTLRFIFGLVCFLYYSNGFGQASGESTNLNAVKIISTEEFQKKVEKSVEQLNSQEINTFADSINIEIIMCLNTIAFTNDSLNHKRFSGGIYEQLVVLTSEKDYLKILMTKFPKNVPSRGLGIYFPELDIELYGTPHPYSYYVFY